nr:unnamed protein product [Callosobruchus chinensis]
MPAKTLCKCCNQACENHQMVTCCVCKNRYKHSRVDITSNEVRVFNTNKGYDWTCEADRSKLANEQSASDKDVVVDVLKEIIPEVSLDSIEPVRLGVFTSSKKRPIKVTLDNNDIVRKVLTNARKLQSSNRYKTIILSLDRTKRQIDFYKATKQKLIERQNSCETSSFLTLKEDTHSNEFFPDDYQVYRQDRRVEVLELCSGGGVLIAIDRNINSVLIDTSYFDDNFLAIDFICCKAHICGTVIFFLALYVPPQVSLYDFDLEPRTMEPNS